MNTTDPTFHDLDPARDLTPEQLDPTGERARATLASITSTDPQAAPAVRTNTLARRRRPRLVPAVGVAAALVVGGTVGPAALGMNSASAQWDALPTGVPAADAKAAAQPCRELIAEYPRMDDVPTWPTRSQVLSMRAVVAEDRGSWRLVVVADDDWEGLCLQQRSTLDRVIAALGGGDGFSGGSGLTQVGGLRKPSPREVRTVDIMGSSVSGTLRATSTVSAITGRVGADVVGVVVEPAGHPKVTATVSNGWFAGWWPEPAADPATAPPPPAVALAVTLRDGSTVRFPVGSEQATPMGGTTS